MLCKIFIQTLPTGWMHKYTFVHKMKVIILIPTTNLLPYFHYHLPIQGRQKTLINISSTGHKLAEFGVKVRVCLLNILFIFQH